MLRLFSANLRGGKQGELPPRASFAGPIIRGTATERGGNTGGQRRCDKVVPPLQSEGEICSKLHSSHFEGEDGGQERVGKGR
jgi:hypothetical protein